MMFKIMFYALGSSWNRLAVTISVYINVWEGKRMKREEGKKKDTRVKICGKDNMAIGLKKKKKETNTVN